MGHETAEAAKSVSSVAQCCKCGAKIAIVSASTRLMCQVVYRNAFVNITLVFKT